MNVAAIDFGRKRIGIAVGDTENGIAHPIAVISRTPGKSDVEAVKRTLDTRIVKKIVVGLPLNMDGTEGPMVRAVRAFGARIEAALSITVEYEDERLSTFEARERMRELRQDGTGGHRGKPVDAIAAAVILESWMARNRK